LTKPMPVALDRRHVPHRRSAERRSPSRTGNATPRATSA